MMKTIEIHEDTAATLRKRAASQALSAEELAELVRQWAAIKAGERTAAHEDVEQWLRTSGTPTFKPWREG